MIQNQIEEQIMESPHIENRDTFLIPPIKICVMIRKLFFRQNDSAWDSLEIVLINAIETLWLELKKGE